MKYLWLCACALLSGCGPTVFPAVQRLPANQQATVNGMWDNMLTPTNRLDRELLLDVLLAYQLHASGIDRLKLECEKDFTGGTARMVLDFDRNRPSQDDRLVFEIRDPKGNLLRRETYSNEEVLSHAQQVFGIRIQAFAMMEAIATTQPSTQPATSPNPATQPTQRKPTADELAQQDWREARWKQIIAATQPVQSVAP